METVVVLRRAKMEQRPRAEIDDLGDGPPHGVVVAGRPFARGDRFRPDADDDLAAGEEMTGARMRPKGVSISTRPSRPPVTTPPMRLDWPTNSIV